MICRVVEEAGAHFGIREGTKTNDGRKVLLVPRVVELLAERQTRTSGPLVFPAPKAGGLWRPSGATQSIKRAAAKLGVTGGFHSRRHGGITHLLEQGVDINTVSKFCGHSDVQMTSGTYGWVSDELAQKQIVAVAGAMNAKPAPAGQISDDVMLRAMEFAEKTGQPLDVVLNLLRGGTLAAE